MTGKELIAAGYKPYKPPLSKYCELAYQKCFRLPDGTKRYFVDVNEYQPIDDRGINYEAMLQVNDGCQWFPTDAAMQILLYGSVREWTVEQLESVAAQIHDRLQTVPYGE